MLTVNGADVSDLAGNAGVNAMSTAWTLITIPPAAPANLGISPDNGVSSSDGLTDTGSVTLSGTLSEPGLTVDVLDATTGMHQRESD